MPKFHFPIVIGQRLKDPVGIKLDNNEAARAQALKLPATFTLPATVNSATFWLETRMGGGR